MGPDYDLETYTNAEVIAVNQDSLGRQGSVVYQDCSSNSRVYHVPLERQSKLLEREGLQTFSVPDCKQIWTRHLADGYAVAFVNYSNSSKLSVQSPLTDGRLVLDDCNASVDAQLWNITTYGLVSTIAAADNTCWEVRACRFEAGAGVDASFGCKAVPPAGDEKACDNNMIW